MTPIGISAIEVALPSSRMPLSEMAKQLNVSESDLFEKIGLREKPILNSPSEGISLAIEAARKSVTRRGIGPTQIDYIVYGSSLLRDHLFSMSSKIQKEIGSTRAFSIDIRNGCNSGNTGLEIAAGLLRSNTTARFALLVLSDSLSQKVDYSNPEHICLFNSSDGASAVLLEKGILTNQLLSFSASTDSRFADNIHLNADGSRMIMRGDIEEEKALTLEYAIRYQEMIRKALDLANLKVSDINHLFMNQGDHRLIQKLEKSLPIAPEKVFRSHSQYGHMGNTDCFLAFKTRLEAGEIQPGHNIVLASSGIGYSWSASVIRG